MNTPKTSTPKQVSNETIRKQVHAYVEACRDKPQAREHSPLPWHGVQNGKQIDIHSRDSSEDREWTVCQHLREKDLRFILEACNNYEQVTAQRDELLAACKRLEGWSGTLCALMDRHEVEIPMQALVARSEAQAAITKATK